MTSIPEYHHSKNSRLQITKQFKTRKHLDILCSRNRRNLKKSFIGKNKNIGKEKLIGARNGFPIQNIKNWSYDSIFYGKWKRWVSRVKKYKINLQNITLFQYCVVVYFKQTGKIEYVFSNIAGTYNQQVLPILVEINLYILIL